MASTTTEKTVQVSKCCSCGNKREINSTRHMIPRGWKRKGDELYCRDCWSKLYCIRAIYLHVAEPLTCDWKEFNALLHEQWGRCRALANWAQTELYMNDPAREREGEKIPKLPALYLYPKARQRYPDIASGTTVSVLHAVEGNYRSDRYDVCWAGSKCLSGYRYPYPLPIRSQDWKAIENEEGKPVVSVPISGQRHRLRLAAGQGRAKAALKDFRNIVTGDALASEITIERRRAPGSNRNDTQARNGNQRAATRVAVKIVGWFPRTPQAGRHGTLIVRTDADCLLIALNEKDDKLWIENMDQLKRWSAEHSRRLQRWSDDGKAEQRPVPSFAARRKNAVHKYRQRIDSSLHEAASHVVNYAKRRRFAAIKYSDKERSYVARLPWEQLRSLIQQKCNRDGIDFHYASGEAETES